MTPVDGQVMDLAAADFDGDGTDELVAVTGAYRPLGVRPSGAILLEEAIASPSARSRAVAPDSSGPRLVVGDGPNPQVRRLLHVDGPRWYAARVSGRGGGRRPPAHQPWPRWRPCARPLLSRRPERKAPPRGL